MNIVPATTTVQPRHTVPTVKSLEFHHQMLIFSNTQFCNSVKSEYLIERKILSEPMPLRLFLSPFPQSSARTDSAYQLHAVQFITASLLPQVSKQPDKVIGKGNFHPTSPKPLDQLSQNFNHI